MSNTKLFFYSIFGFVTGVTLKSLFIKDSFSSDFYSSLFVILCGTTILFLLLLLKNNWRESLIFLIPIFIIAIGLGMLRFDFANYKKGEQKLDSLVGDRVVLEGIISDEIDERETNTHITIQVNKIIDGGNKTEIKEKINALVLAQKYPIYKYGDKILVKGYLKKPTNFASELGKEFDYISYLSKEQIFYLVINPQITYLASGEGSFIKEKLLTFKNYLLGNISENINEPESTLMGGLIFGSKHSLSKEWENDFRRTGLIHIIVLSGYNITIISNALLSIFSFLPFNFKFGIGSLGIILFVIMVGASATAIRAAIMALVAIYAHIKGRSYRVDRALLFAGFLMLLQNPKILFFDPSFQLSFLATIGLVYLSPIIKKKFQFVTNKFEIRELLVSTIATQMFVYPFLLYKMGQISIIAIPVNLLVLMFIPTTMFFGFLTSIAGIFGTFITFPFASISYFFLHYILSVVHTFSQISFASVTIKNFPLVLVLIIYTFLFYWIYKKRKRAD